MTIEEKVQQQEIMLHELLEKNRESNGNLRHTTILCREWWGAPMNALTGWKSL